jgi:DNA replication protein DnaC
MPPPENWRYHDFLAVLLNKRFIASRTRLQLCTRKAHFPFFKTIDEFDFSLQASLRQPRFASYLGPDVVTEGRRLILYGREGRGKTHLAVAMAIVLSRMASRRFVPRPQNSTKI